MKLVIQTYPSYWRRFSFWTQAGIQHWFWSL